MTTQHPTLSKITVFLGAIFGPCLALAQSGGAPVLSDENVGPFGNIVAILQGYVNFFTGPLAFLIIIVAALACGFLWVFAPRMGDAIGSAMRLVVVGIILLNLGTFLGTLTGVL